MSVKSGSVERSATGYSVASKSKGSTPGKMSQSNAKPKNMFDANTSKIAVELSKMEERSRTNFENNCHLLKKPRNPCNGELTSREDAEYLIPFEKAINASMLAQTRAKYHQSMMIENESRNLTSGPATSSLSQYPSNRRPKFDQLSTLKQRKFEIDNELEQMNKVLAFKQQCLHRTQATEYSNANMDEIHDWTK